MHGSWDLELLADRRSQQAVCHEHAASLMDEVITHLKNVFTRAVRAACAGSTPAAVPLPGAPLPLLLPAAVPFVVAVPFAAAAPSAGTLPSAASADSLPPTEPWPFGAATLTLICRHSQNRALGSYIVQAVVAELLLSRCLAVCALVRHPSATAPRCRMQPDACAACHKQLLVADTPTASCQAAADTT